MPTNCVWLDGINEKTTEKYLARHVSRIQAVSQCLIDHDRGRALLFYDTPEQAQRVVNEMRGRTVLGQKLQVRN